MPVLLAEFGEVGRRREPVGGRLVRVDTEEAVALEMQRVEDDPCRVVRVAVARVEVLERARHRVVFACLVEEPLARPVDDDASRTGPFQSHAAAARMALRRCRRAAARSAPTRPRPCWPGRRRAPSPCAARRRCCSAVTPRRASGRADRPRPAWRPTRIRRSPARRRAWRAREVLAVVGDSHAGDSPAIGDELDRAGIRSRRHARRRAAPSAARRSTRCLPRSSRRTRCRPTHGFARGSRRRCRRC